jgi:hypothetical protein
LLVEVMGPGGGLRGPAMTRDAAMRARVGIMRRARMEELLSARQNTRRVKMRIECLEWALATGDQEQTSGG